MRDVAVRVASRRMFSDLSDIERAGLVELAVDAWTHAWGPAGRPADVEAWLARGMFSAMMHDFARRRMLLRPARRDAVSLDELVEQWLAAEPAPDDTESGLSGAALVDRYLRLLSPADARLLWMRCEAFTREEIADVLGIRPNAVGVRLRRLQLRLREALEPLTAADAGAASHQEIQRDSGTGVA